MIVFSDNVFALKKYAIPNPNPNPSPNPNPNPNPSPNPNPNSNPNPNPNPNGSKDITFAEFASYFAQHGLNRGARCCLQPHLAPKTPEPNQPYA